MKCEQNQLFIENKLKLKKNEKVYLYLEWRILKIAWNNTRETQQFLWKQTGCTRDLEKGECVYAYYQQQYLSAVI